MNRSKLKTYAPKARRDFIRAMTDRAAFYGLTEEKIEPITEKGDIAIIAGKAHPIGIATKRRLLESRIKPHGFEQVMEAVAYTWFNRLVAIRFMEHHGYLDHGYRVLSHPEGKQTPEILEHAEHVDLAGLDKQRVIALKMDGTKDTELYRMLLIAQCNALHSAMPFLFEKIDDETELLLPDNLLHSDSLVRQLVSEIDEDDWQEVEIIGWLYQFYISEKKDEVIGKVVKSEDIPAATQLFTPNWIVKYLVQNSLGRQWLATYPNSPLRQQLEYYIEPAEQTPEVQAQLKAITPTELNPEDLTLMDPACGSGHILVEGYDIFKAIYQERGYRAKDIPRLILEKNLFGLEIDDRAAQLAAFALMMKARADDRRIFDSEAKPNILAFQDSQGMNAADITHALNSPINKEEAPPSEYLIEEIEEAETPLFSKKATAIPGHVSQGDIASLLDLFENAKTFGSLLQVPPKLAAKLPDIEQRLKDVLKFGDLMHKPAQVIKPLLQLARLLVRRYDAVVANPPYMGIKYYSPSLKTFVNREYKQSKADLYSCFMQRNSAAAKSNGFVGMITIPNWMFLSSFEDMRKSLFAHQTIDTFVHNGRGVFGSDFGSCAFVFRNNNVSAYCGSYRRLFDKPGSVASNSELEERFHSVTTYKPSNTTFGKIPGSPVAYWVRQAFITLFERNSRLGDLVSARVGLLTSDNSLFLRYWWEVSALQLCLNATTSDEAAKSRRRWFPHNKGGAFRKWAGNQDYVVDWEDNGRRIKETVLKKYPYLKGNPNFVVHDDGYYFRPSISWSEITISATAFRYFPAGFTFNVKGMSAFPSDKCTFQQILALCNTNIVSQIIAMLNPTVGFGINNFDSLPAAFLGHDIVAPLVDELVNIAQNDWDSFETSWNFRLFPVLQHETSTLRQSQERTDCEWLASLARMKELEEKNNRSFIEAYGLQDELSPEVPDDHITLYRPDREEDIKRLVSYAIGCMMGRYSLDEPGLIYARSGNKDFDPTPYKSFPADQDGILPLTDTVWFDDDTTNRGIEFIGVAWPKEQLEENLTFIADSLGPNKGEQPRDTIRRYLAQDFYKDHLKTYKKRPIYWLFSSGKLRAFQCLVYLHRYNEGTLSRMRTEYVIPLQGKISARVEQLAGDISAATASTYRTKLTKERDKLLKQQKELGEFDDKLRHYADMRIAIDLDDGVKVNYGKFGDLLAEVKAITGGSEE
jgi:hypothetical protein